MKLVLASYNIHRCYGRDGRYQPARIRQILHEMGAQVIALQEVELLHDAPGLLDFFCKNTNLKAIAGLTLSRESGQYGNALLTSLPVESVRRIDLSYPDREPRGALQVGLRHADQTLSVIATHLGLHPAERRAQVQNLLRIVQVGDAQTAAEQPTILLGDLNEWFLWGRPRRWLKKHFGGFQAPATYPAGWPVLTLDHILVKPVDLLRRIEVVKNDLTRIASDHLPIVATIDVSSKRR